jgi:hypothetical protein
MTKNIKNGVATAFILGALLVPAFAFAQAPITSGGNLGGVVTNVSPTTAGGNTGSAVTNTAPASTGGNIGGAVTNTPPGTAGGNTGSAVTNTSPATAGGNTGSGVTNTAPATAGGNTGAAVPQATPPATAGGNTGSAVTNTPPATNGGGSTPTGTGNSAPNVSVGSGGSSGASGSALVLPVLTNIGDCDYLGSYMKAGKANVYADVIKLQNFLNTYEGMNVFVTGQYDAQTIAAVNAFQVKYTDDVLLPWGVSTPTSQVYYTTSKKINEIFCKKSFALTPAQLAEITAYRTSLQNRTVDMTQDVGTNETSGTGSVVVGTTGTDTSTDVTSTTTTHDTQVAAVAKTSIFSKIWNFIKRIFGR